MIKKHTIPLTIQAYKLQSYFPDSKCSIRNNTLTWKGFLQPMVLSLKYWIKLVYQKDTHPDVYVLDPKPLIFAEGKTKLEHVYNTKKQHLCLYYRKANEWDASMFIANTIIPWTSEWLLHYEVWVATGVWHGGGIHSNINTVYKSHFDRAAAQRKSVVLKSTTLFNSTSSKK